MSEGPSLTPTTRPPADPSPPAAGPRVTVLSVLFSLSLSHGLNDTIQSLIPAIYPLVKAEFGLSFTQIGLITLTFYLTAALRQPPAWDYHSRGC